MANGPSVVAVFLVFAVLAGKSIALRSPSPFRSLRFQAHFANGECRFGVNRMDRGYVTLKDGRCFEATCAPGSYKVSFTPMKRCMLSSAGTGCFYQDGDLETQCCMLPQICF
uniref:Putative kDa family member n=1 Tax=Rhipicephalus microplus TaxID=6941 RepID=A0A6G5A5R5_RHIMP